MAEIGPIERKEENMTKQQQSERDGYIADLRETLKPGDTLYTVLRSVSRTGMSRVIDVYYLANGDANKDGTLRPPVKMWLSYRIAKACGLTFMDSGRHGTRNGAEGIKIGGCGMDMGFEIVYTLGRVLYPNGFPCAGERCPSNDHSNGDRNRRKGHMHTDDGGYAFRQEWL